MLVVGEFLLGMTDFGSFLLLLVKGLIDILFSELYLKTLEFLLLLKEGKFAVVAHIVDLLLIFRNLLATHLDVGFLGLHQFAELLNLILIFLDTCLIAHRTRFEIGKP